MITEIKDYEYQAFIRGEKLQYDTTVIREFAQIIKLISTAPLIPMSHHSSLQKTLPLQEHFPDYFNGL